MLMKTSYDWFVKRHRTRGLELAHDQVTSAFDTVAWLQKATQSFSAKNLQQTKKYLENLYKTEESVDLLRSEVFLELSKGTALLSDYREDLLHLVKRADTLADHTKDAARCLELLLETDIPQELVEKIVLMSEKLVEMVNMLRESVEKISSNSAEAIKGAVKVSEIEHTVDSEYLITKSLFLRYGEKMNNGALVIFDDLIEFIEQAADMCADTADYINVLSSQE
jgi:predicted phosphate transport protein (TIGR00153 family)